MLNVSDKLPVQKSNYMTEAEVCEYVMNHELSDKVSIFGELESGDNLYFLSLSSSSSSARIKPRMGFPDSNR